jgi:hypothetical protein
VSEKRAAWDCPESIGGHDDGDRDGLCTWCRKRVNAPVPMPDLGSGYRTELGQAYRQFYDPDWGTDSLDY